MAEVNKPGAGDLGQEGHKGSRPDWASGGGRGRGDRSSAAPGGATPAGPPLRRPDAAPVAPGQKGPGGQGNKAGGRPNWGETGREPGARGSKDAGRGSRAVGPDGAGPTRAGDKPEKPSMGKQLGNLAKKTARESVEGVGGAGSGLGGKGGANKFAQNRQAGMSTGDNAKSVIKEKAAAAAVTGIKKAGNSLFPFAGDATVFGLRLAKILAPVIGMGLLVFAVIMVAIFSGGSFGSLSSMTYALAPGAPQGIPANYLAAYQAAGQQYNIPWTVLAGVGEVATQQGTSAPSDVADYHAHVNRLYPTSGSNGGAGSIQVPTSPGSGGKAGSNKTKKPTKLPTIIGNSCLGSSCVVSPPIGTGAGEPKGPLLLNASWLAKNANGMNPQSINDSAMMLASALASAESAVLQSDSTGKYSNYTGDPTQADAFWAAVVAQAPITLPDQVVFPTTPSAGSGGASAVTVSIASTPSGGNWVKADQASCPSTPAGPGGPAPGAVMGTSLSLLKICQDSVAAAATPQAAIAIIKALTNLGLIYTENTNPFAGPLRSDTLYSDCSSYVSRMYNEAGVNVNPDGSTFTIAADTAAFKQEESWNARPGDLVMFANEQHVGMVLADGMIAENGMTGPPPLGSSHIDVFGGPSWANALYFRVDPSGAGASSGVIPFAGPGLTTSNVLIANPVDWSVVQFAIYYGGDYPGDTRAGSFTAAGAANYVGGSTVSTAQVTSLIQQYWPKSEWDNAERIVSCESSNNPSAVDPDSNGTQDLGLFQLNTINIPKLLTATGYPSTDESMAFNAGWNVQAAEKYWQSEVSNKPIGSGWWPWVCASKLNIVNGLYSHIPGPGDTSGLYQQYTATQG